MKTLHIILLSIIFTVVVKAQGIGEFAEEKPPEKFPANSVGMDLMFNEGGFGLGTFYRRELSDDFMGFVDFSISEAKDEREFDFYDPYTGQTYTYNKKNRIFLLPFNFGAQYRLFQSLLTDNLRPYINAGVGPSLVVTTPYSMEFFDSFKKAQGRWTIGGYIGFGANFGLDKKNLVGLNVRYYFVHFFNEGVEGLNNRFRKDLGGIYVAINVGIMY